MIDRANADVDNVFLQGPLFEEHVEKPVLERPFKGSAMVVKESSWQGFMDRIGSDPYVEQMIWDLEKTQFIPFRTIYRTLLREQVD